MKKYDKSAVMKSAWRIFRQLEHFSWSRSLTMAWEIEKENCIKDISPIAINRILNGLRSFNRSRTITENKPMLAGTQEHFKLLNSRTGRRIMKLPAENDSKEMLAEGELFGLDIIHQRIKESKRFIEPTRKIKKVFRNRIINLETCIPVNIEEYVNRK